MKRPSKLEPTASLKRTFGEDFSDHKRKIKTAKASEPVKYNFEQNSLEHAQAHLLLSGSSSDLKITCQGRIWKVHRCILMLRCPFFGDYINIGIIFYYTHFGGVIRHERSNALSCLMDNFFDRLDAPAQRLRWLYKGARIHPSETPDTLGMQDGGCVEVVREQPANDQLVEWAKEAKKGMTPVRQEDGTHWGSVEYVSIINMDEDDPVAVEGMLQYLYSQQLHYTKATTEHSLAYCLAIVAIADKYHLPCLAASAGAGAQDCIKSSPEVLIPQLAEALQSGTATQSLLGMREDLIRETAQLFCYDDSFTETLEHLTMTFPKFAFEVFNYARREFQDQIKAMEEDEHAGQDDEKDDDAEDEYVEQPQRTTRSKTKSDKTRAGGVAKKPK